MWSRNTQGTFLHIEVWELPKTQHLDNIRRLLHNSLHGCDWLCVPCLDSHAVCFGLWSTEERPVSSPGPKWDRRWGQRHLRLGTQSHQFSTQATKRKRPGLLNPRHNTVPLSPLAVIFPLEGTNQWIPHLNKLKSSWVMIFPSDFSTYIS